MLNHVTLLGRLAQDPELRHTQSNTPVTSFDLAVPVYSRGEQELPPDYIPVVCWNKTAEFVVNYLEKGRQIVVEGRIKARKYTDKDGNNRKAVEVHATSIYFADSKKAGASGDSSQQNTNGEYSGAPAGFSAIDEDIPF